MCTCAYTLLCGSNVSILPFSSHHFLITVQTHLSLPLSDLLFTVLCNPYARLYTEDYFVKEMPAEGIPEIQRSNLVSCVIQVCISCTVFVPLFI